MPRRSCTARKAQKLARRAKRRAKVQAFANGIVAAGKLVLWKPWAFAGRKAKQKAKQAAAKAAKTDVGRALGGVAKKATAPVRRAALDFGELERQQLLALNVTDAHPLLARDDKCCNRARFVEANCCRPHALFWQARAVVGSIAGGAAT